MASGMIAELVTPVRKRARVSHASEPASALNVQQSAAPMQAMATTGIMP